jgi:hypothetical protein
MSTRNLAITVLGTLAFGAQAMGSIPDHRRDAAGAGYVVEAGGAASVTQAVRRVGGRITHELPVIDGVSATLTPVQVAKLRRNTKFALVPAAQVMTLGDDSGSDVHDGFFVGAVLLTAQGINGRGVTVAVLDSGIWDKSGQILAQYDAIAGGADGDAGNREHDLLAQRQQLLPVLRN